MSFKSSLSSLVKRFNKRRAGSTDSSGSASSSNSNEYMTPQLKQYLESQGNPLLGKYTSQKEVAQRQIAQGLDFGQKRAQRKGRKSARKSAKRRNARKSRSGRKFSGRRASAAKRRSARKAVQTRCKNLLSKKISTNMKELKKGKFKSRAQAIAVAYSQVRKKYPSCAKMFKK
jgi:hypothetical protein